MREFLLLMAPGCFGAHCARSHAPGTVDCSYGAGPVIAKTSFSNATWNDEDARVAIEAVGFHAEPPVAQMVHGTNGSVGIWLRALTNATIGLSLDFASPEQGPGLLTQSEADQVLNATEADARPRAEAIVAALVARTGWSRAGELEWQRAMSVV